MLGGQGLWKLLEMLTPLPWIREREQGAGAGAGGEAGCLLALPASLSLDGSPACAPSVQHAVNHVSLEGCSAARTPTHSMPGAPPSYDNHRCPHLSPSVP